MGATDAMLERLTGELEERRAFQEHLANGAMEKGRDLDSREMELYKEAGKRMEEIEGMLGPMRESARISVESRAKTAEISRLYEGSKPGVAPSAVEYRSAGAYIADLYHAQLGDPEATRRVETFNRVAAHQTTTDNPGLLPETIVSPIVNFVDTARPLVNAIGVTDLGPGSWAYARVTQHTQVGVQSAEKAELASRKMTITKTSITGDTYGGYVNISQQDIRRTRPGIVDMVINDLAGQYAIETEEATGTALVAAATAGPEVPVTPTAAELATGIYGAAGSVYAATKGQGRVVVAVSPDMLGVVGPLFPPVNPQNAYGTGFSAAGFNQGVVGNVSGLSVVMSAGLAAETILVFSTAAVALFEYKYGNLQVVEPSVWGLQVGYAGDFEALAHTATGIYSVTIAAA